MYCGWFTIPLYYSGWCGQTVNKCVFLTEFDIVAILALTHTHTLKHTHARTNTQMNHLSRSEQHLWLLMVTSVSCWIVSCASAFFWCSSRYSWLVKMGRWDPVYMWFCLLFILFMRVRTTIRVFVYGMLHISRFPRSNAKKQFNAKFVNMPK